MAIVQYFVGRIPKDENVGIVFPIIFSDSLISLNPDNKTPHVVNSGILGNATFALNSVFSAVGDVVSEMVLGAITGPFSYGYRNANTDINYIQEKEGNEDYVSFFPNLKKLDGLKFTDANPVYTTTGEETPINILAGILYGSNANGFKSSYDTQNYTHITFPYCMFSFGYNLFSYSTPRAYIDIYIPLLAENLLNDDKTLKEYSDSYNHLFHILIPCDKINGKWKVEIISFPANSYYTDPLYGDKIQGMTTTQGSLRYKYFLKYPLSGPPVPIDPYSPGGTSGTGGGGGTYSTDSDAIPIPSLPSLDAVKAGFISLYSPTLSQLNNLASYMWGDSFDVNTFKKIFADPMDAIIGLSIVPGSVPTAGTDSIKIGFIDTGVSMNKAATQYASLDCGTLDIQNFFGSFLDYSPYTKFSIFLPYIGTRQLDTDDIMGKQLHLVYNIDYLTGTLCAMLEVSGAVLYEFSGSCAASIPLTGQNFTQMIVSGIQLATSITAGVATAGATTAANVASAAGMVGSTAGTVAGMKPSIQKTGAVSGAAGMLGVQIPYLIWEIPKQALPENFNTFYGYPSNITKVLKDCNGYTEVDDIHIYNIYATDAELREIESLLKGGVII